MKTTETPKFSLGRVVATVGAMVALTHSGEDADEYLDKHVAGNWGDGCEEENEFALQNGLRLLSSYRLLDYTRIWIITEADRSVTTILLPSEY